MTYAGNQIFMEKLKQLINCNHIPFIINNPAIICERPQFQLLYQELGSMIQPLFIEQHQELETVNDLKKAFIDAVEKAEYLVDVFLSGVHIRNNQHLLTYEDFSHTLNPRRSFKSIVHLFLSCVHITNNPSLNLDKVRRSFKSVEVEFQMRIASMKMDSSPRPERTLNQSAAAAQSSISRISLGSKNLLDEILVGLDRDVEIIRDKLVEDQKKLDVVSIVGMGGIGKTTLAAKVFNDAYFKHHFHVRVWVTVSQTYDKRGVLTQVLESVRSQLDLEKASDSHLRELVHKQLMGKRYLVVIDDIWNIETWDDLKLFFPHGNNGSRILLTSRITEVAKHANSNGLIHHLAYLNKETSYELLCQKVFHGNECPKWSFKPGMQIAEKCQGLPLAVVVIAGILAKEAWSEKFWMEIAKSTDSYIVGDQNGCQEILGLSYNHLPLHLRECFLYLGGFPEDYKFKVKRLIWLWVAEGFIQEDGNRSLEDIAEGYLMDLIDRNLVNVAHMSKSNGGVKECNVHDFVRELCLRKAKEEQFILQTERLILSSQFSNVNTLPYNKPVRMFINEDIYDFINEGTYDPDFPHPSAQNLRSFLCFGSFDYLVHDTAKCFHSFVLLRVLDLQKYILNHFPEGMELLVHLRYLAIRKDSPGFPSSICNLWGLQTLIYNTLRYDIDLPSNVSNLVNLRHLWINPQSCFILTSVGKPMKLQTFSGVDLGKWLDYFQKCFPCIKELKCFSYSEKQYNLQSLTCLEKLKLCGVVDRRMSPVETNSLMPSFGKNHITFPLTLKTLTLDSCCLQWSDMSIIQSLPNLQVLKLHHKGFVGSYWNTDGQKFQQLKLLRLNLLDIKLWEARSRSFPCLKQLEIICCEDLEEIPLEIGDIPTLELIKIYKCRHSVGESVRRIQEEQHDLGNYDLKIDIFHEI